MIKSTSILLAMATLSATSQLVSAQVVFSRSHTYVVPRTTTYVDVFGKGHHYQAVPRTTTHFDRVTHTTYRRAGPTIFAARVLPRTTTHVVQSTHLHSVPRTTHVYRSTRTIPSTIVPRTIVPSATIHFGGVRRSSYLNVVPRSTLHLYRY